MIEYKFRNLFCSEADALAQGCNTIGKMNDGIAKQFRKKFPEMYEDYKKRCRRGLFLPGQGYIFYNKNPPHIINLATQGNEGAGIVYVESALKWLSDSHEDISINSVAMPKIAAGLGKLEWEIVKEIIEKYFKNSDLNVEIWSLN